MIEIPRVNTLNLESLPEEEIRVLRTGLTEYLVQAAREDPNIFVSLHFGKPPHPMHREFQRLATEDQRFLLAAMRESGKSTQITVLRALWELGRNPDLRIKIVSVNQKRAAKFVGAIAKHIKDPTGQGLVTRLVFPGLKPDPNRAWSSEQINIVRSPDVIDDRDPTVEAWGISSSPEGGRADILIFDDITSYETSVTEARTRENIKEVFKGTWLDIKAGPSTRYWYLCTLWHEDDCSAAVMKTPGWSSYVYAISEDFEHIDTNYGARMDLPYPSAASAIGGEDWSARTLKEEYKSRGAFYFNRSFRNNPTSEMSRLFKKTMFYGTKGVGGAIKYGIPPWHEMFKDYPKYSGVDLGIGQLEHHKPSVIFTAAVADGSDDAIPQGTRIVVDIRKGNWNSPDTARQLVEMYNELRPELIKVENNYYQQALLDWLGDIKGVDLPLSAHFTGGQKLHPELGIPLLAAEFERQRWIVPYQDKHSDDCKCNFCQWVREMLNYSMGSKSTDLVMACVVEDSLVSTQEGLIPIQNIGVGDSVLTHKGNWQKVIAVSKRFYKGKVIRIKPSGSPPIVVTPGHPVFSALTGVDTSSRKNTICPKEWEFRSAGELTSGRGKAGGYVMNPVPTAYSGRCVDHIDISSHASGHFNGWKVQGDFLVWRDRRVPRCVHIDEDVAILIGLYLAEGSTSGEGPHQVCLSFHEDEIDLIEFVREIFDKKFGLKASVYSGGGKCSVVCVSCKPLARFFRCTFGAGASKALPWDMFDLPVPRKLSIVMGWLMGDGSLGRYKNSASTYFKGVSISRNLIHQMATILRQGGFHPGVNRHIQPVVGGFTCSPSPCWNLRLVVGESTKLWEASGSVARCYWNAFVPHGTKRTNVRWFQLEDGIANRIGLVEEEDYCGYVYNFHVAGDNSYVVEETAIHNCWFAQRGIKESEMYGGGYGIWQV